MHAPHASLPPPGLPPEARASALQQAARDAAAVPGAFAQQPWAFRKAPPAAKGLLDAHSGRDAEWMVVTCRSNDDVGHTRERCYTAVQRYLLSLAAEGVEATWIGSGLPVGLARAAALAGADDLLGVVRVDG